MNKVIFKKKLIKDLLGIHDVLMGQGDPILASMINVAIDCVEQQEAVPYSGTGGHIDEPKKEKRILKATKRFEQEYAAAKQRSMIHDPVAYALYQTWKAADEGRL